MPMLPDLPYFRVANCPCFTTTGTDCAGSFFITDPQDIKRLLQSWIAIFICLNLHFVHIELVPDMMANTFILCLCKFIRRQGVPEVLVCDNSQMYKR